MRMLQDPSLTDDLVPWTMAARWSPPVNADRIFMLDVNETEGSMAPLTVANGVGTVTLTRPTRRNAVSWQLVLDLISSLRSARSSPHVRVLVITGAGRDFCVGADLARVASDSAADQDTRTLRGRSVEDDTERLTMASTVTEMLVSFPKPTVAAINGACAGAGLSIALATDLQIAASDAVFNTAFVSAGVPGDFGSAWLLTRAVGTGRARSLLLDPGKMTSSEAAAIGLVTEVAVDFEARVAELSQKLSNQPATAMAHAKRNLLDAVSGPLPDYLRLEIPRMVDSARSDEARAAARAFLNKKASPSEGSR